MFHFLVVLSQYVCNVTIITVFILYIILVLYFNEKHKTYNNGYILMSIIHIDIHTFHLQLLEYQIFGPHLVDFTIN